MRRRQLAVWVSIAGVIVALLASCDGPADMGTGDGLEGGTAPLRVAEGPAGAVLAFVPVSVEGEGPFAFALDTGASRSVVDEQVAERAGLQIVAEDQPVTGVGGATQADVAAVETWRAGELELPSARVSVLGLPEPGRSRDRSPQGLLGSDVLSGFGLVTVDYNSQQLTLGRAEAPDREGWRSVELRVVEGATGSVLAFVSVSIGEDGPFPFALDTGASRTVVDADIAERLGLDVVERNRPVTGIAGAERADVVRVDSWRAGGLALPSDRIGVLDLPEPPRGAEEHVPRGLLGSDVLSRFGAIAIDYDEQLLSLRPRD